MRSLRALLARLGRRQVCTKCGKAQPLAEFEWDDGLKQGTTTRCKTCRSSRRGCPECIRLRGGRHYGRRAKPPRCEACRAAARLPDLPLERYRIRGHAMVRFQQRVRPDLTHRSAVLHEMIRLMHKAPLSAAPAWYETENKERAVAQYARGYLYVMDGVVFALADYGGRTKVSTVMAAPSYVPPPAAPVPLWVTTAEEQYRTHVQAKRDREALEREDSH